MKGSLVDVGIRELRDHLSRHLSAVRSGSTITVTDHGQPVARIVPVGQLSSLEALRATGRVTPASGRTRPTPQPVDASGTVSDLIDEQRR